MSIPAVEPVRFSRDDRDAAVAALVAAFDDGPIMRYLLPGPTLRAHGLRAFFRAAIADAAPFGEVWVAKVDGVVSGVAVWLPPGRYPPTKPRQVKQVAALLAVAPRSPSALVRTLRYVRVVERKHPHAEHWYLGILGVDPAHQGRGLGTALLDRVLPRVDAAGLPTYLETDKERNLAYYARQRFELVETLHPTADGPPTWTMWREPPAP